MKLFTSCANVPITVFSPSNAPDVHLNSAVLRQVIGNAGSVVEVVLMVMMRQDVSEYAWIVF